MKKKIIVVLLASLVLGAAAYYYVWYGGARNVASEETYLSVTSNDIAKEFSSDTQKANTKYLEKAIEISGIVTTATDKQVILDNGIVCDLKEIDATIQKEQQVTLKGRVVGYDDLMAEIKLDQCSKINND